MTCARCGGPMYYDLLLEAPHCLNCARTAWPRPTRMNRGPKGRLTNGARLNINRKAKVS